MPETLTAISDPTRRAALALLSGGDENCVCDLMARLDASQSRMSRQMNLLREAGHMFDRWDAQWVRYPRNSDFALEFAAVMNAVLASEVIAERRSA